MLTSFIHIDVEYKNMFINVYKLMSSKVYNQFVVEWKFMKFERARLCIIIHLHA